MQGITAANEGERASEGVGFWKEREWPVTLNAPGGVHSCLVSHQNLSPLPVPSLTWFLSHLEK